MACEIEEQNVGEALALLEANEAQQQAIQMELQQLQWAHDALMAQLWGAYQLWLICLNNSQVPEAALKSVPVVKQPSFSEWLAKKRKRSK